MTIAAIHHKFSVDDYYAMARAGILPDHGVELLDGEVVEKMTIGEDHSWCVGILLEIFSSLLLGRVWLNAQCPIRINANSLPEPDLVLARTGERRYRHRHPGPEDIYLLVEVAESSLSLDRTDKARLYATAGIPEYWIVNIPEQQFEIHRLPVGGAYQQVSVVPLGGAVAPLAFPAALVQVSEVVG